jgi:hypothetical protein
LARERFLPKWRGIDAARRDLRLTTSRAPWRCSRQPTSSQGLCPRKKRRACELWNEGDKALAHIHLAHAGLPPYDEVQALRRYAAE